MFARGPLPRTGHDVHFLSRLERVDRRQTELALRLYRDPELVRGILADRGVPEGAPDIAIALEPGPCPPHVIVARSGRFVTCLAASMSPHPSTRVLPFERLGRHLRRADLLAEQRAAADAAIEEAGGLEPLVEATFRAGTQLSREEFRQLAAVEPLLREAILHCIVPQVRIIHLLGPAVLRARRARTLTPLENEAVRFYWSRCHALGHFLLLLGLGGRPVLDGWIEREQAAAPNGDVNLIHNLLVPIFTLCDFGLTMRAAWALGRAGKTALPYLKSELPQKDNVVEWMGVAASLLTIGFGHRKLRAEVARLFPARRAPDFGPGPLSEETGGLLHRFADCFLVSGCDPAPLCEHQAERTAERCAAEGRAAEVPVGEDGLPTDEFTFLHLANRGASLIENPERVMDLLEATPLLAGADAEDFYFPASELSRWAEPYSRAAAERLALPFAPDLPAQAEPRPGRNERCPCGSGRKYKRCCAGAGAHASPL